MLNNRREVVALHHKSVPKVNKNGEVVDVNGRVMSEELMKETPELVAWAANEGIRVSKIVGALRRATPDSEAQKVLLERTLGLWADPKAPRPGRKRVWLGR